MATKLSRIVNDDISVINLTGEDIVIVDNRGERCLYPSYGILKLVPRIAGSIIEYDDDCVELDIYACDKIECVNSRIEIDINTPKDGVLYIVSAEIKAANPQRKDFITPIFPVRDSDGVIKGYRGFLI